MYVYPFWLKALCLCFSCDCDLSSTALTVYYRCCQRWFLNTKKGAYFPRVRVFYDGCLHLRLVFTMFGFI